MSVKGKKPKSSKSKIKKGPKMSIRQYVLVGIMMLAMIGFIFSSLPAGTLGSGRTTSSASKPNKSQTNTSTTAPSEPQFKEEGSLRFVSAVDNGEIRSIKIELADTEGERARGMMYRKSIPTDTGMLFIMETQKLQSFYMRNTYVSLDIIFIDENKKIVNIAKETVPLTETNVSSTGPAKYVLEVAAGYTDAYGIKAGDLVDF